MATKKSGKSEPKTKDKGLVATLFGSAEDDIVSLILEEHKPLKALLKSLQNPELDLEERRAAFEEFAPLLESHAKPEERVLYNFMKMNGELREEGFEGDVEHGLAEQMIEEAKRTDDVDLWSARVKVLGELVEHHIQEEEDDLFPDFKKHSDKTERKVLAEEYLQAKAEFQTKESDEVVAEEVAEIHAH